MREGLTNAAKHAPGAEVTMALRRSHGERGEDVTVTVTSAAPPAAPVPTPTAPSPPVPASESKPTPTPTCAGGPARPQGARCAYYRVSGALFVGVDDYRLCFRDGRLVDKALIRDVLNRALDDPATSPGSVPK
ncbi:hypothetical protein ACWGJ2_34025 [Streptomyces sp. NPDC054796]